MNVKYAIALLLVCPLAWAQDPVGAIEGSVADQSAAAVSARVAATNLATGFVRQTTANASGIFRIPLLPVGEYRVTVDAPHFATLVQEPVTLNVSQTVRVEYQLQVAAVKATVTVRADAPLVDTSSNALGAV